jgi:3-methyladenine DNA glycosylase AlkD
LARLQSARLAQGRAVTKTEVLGWLERNGSARQREGMKRYGLPNDHAVGMSMGKIQAFAKRIGKDHALAQQLWASGGYEARMVAAYIDEPAKVTRRQMDAWARDFDNWGTCDTVCFVLFDRTPFAYYKVKQWAKSEREFVRRAAFALMASLAGHDKKAPDARFLELLPLVEKYAGDDRNFVKKGVSWALRRTGTRGPALKKACIAVARRLAASDDSTARWIGKDALRDLERKMVAKRR